MDDGAGGLRRSRFEVKIGLADLLTSEGEDREGGELRADAEREARGPGGC